MCKDLVALAKAQVREIVADALDKAAADGALTFEPGTALPAFVVETPADVSHGDFACNAAMASARALKTPPAKIADELLARMRFENTVFCRAEKAGPGFLNFFLRPAWFADVLAGVRALGGDYGRTDIGGGERVMVEFVSANPTGPMHMGNARGGAIGDCLAGALDAAGYQVHREFYVNDAGNQIEKFGVSLEARYLQIFKGEDAVPFPEDGYHGDDIRVRAKQFADIHGDGFVNADSAERQSALVAFALPKNIEALKTGLAAYRIEYDNWFHESSLYENGDVDNVVGILGSRDMTYESDGALWYKATAKGAEKDEVLVRQNGHATYFAADVAYHYNKFAVRGFDRVIDVWGADHHGHVARMKAAMDAVGLSGDKLDIVLNQLVRLMKDGEPYRMSKRSGMSVTLADLLELVPVDAARFFFNLSSPASAMDFDLTLAVQQNSQNPVFYVQYAHARIASLLKRLAEQGTEPRECPRQELLLLQAPEELALIRHIAALPSEIALAATRLDPSGLAHYAIELATRFHKFYEKCRVQCDEEPLMQARLALCLCVRQALANVLGIMKVTAPDTM